MSRLNIKVDQTIGLPALVTVTMTTDIFGSITEILKGSFETELLSADTTKRRNEITMVFNTVDDKANWLRQRLVEQHFKIDNQKN